MPDPSPSPLVSAPPGVLERLRQLPRRDWSDYDSSPTPKRSIVALILWAVLSIGGSSACVAMSYFDGSRGDLYDPLTNLGVFAALVCGLIVLVCTIIALVRRHHIRLSLLILLGVIGVWFLSAFLIPRTYLLGLKNRMVSAMTPDQMRVVAARAREILTLPNPTLRGPRDSAYPQRPEDARRWQELSALPGMANLGKRINISSFEDGVRLYWDAGGWDIDWGVRINPDGVHQSEGDTFFWAWQHDIGFFYANY